MWYSYAMSKEIKSILVASDSFKGSLSSREIADIFVDVAKVGGYPFAVKGVEIADGGEGTLDAILASTDFEPISVECLNPLFEPIEATYAMCEDVAIVELAKSAGLTLIKYREGNAMRTTTYGVGQLIKDAISKGAKRIYLCVGGSATNDGGIGALSALGYEFWDENGNKLSPIGENLGKIASVRKVSDIADGIEFTILADVDNPLVGKNGATYVYGKQKGATNEQLDLLECGMQNYADITEAYTGVRMQGMKGAGAAGGIAGGFMAYLNGKMQSGIESVLDIIHFSELVQKSDIVITGEGKIDEQSLCGKAVFGVYKRAKLHTKPVYVIAGDNRLSKEQYEKMGIKGVTTLACEAQSVDDSICNAKKYAKIAVEKLLKRIKEDCDNG